MTQELNSPPGKFVTCYITSKRIHAPKLIALRGSYPGIHFTARWPVTRDVATEQATPARIWFQDNVDDILRSDNFVCNAEPSDVLNQSLIELGIAWKAGIPIWLAGDNPGFKEWRAASGIRSVPSLDDALKEVQDTGRYDNNHFERLSTMIRDAEQRLQGSVQSVREAVLARKP